MDINAPDFSENFNMDNSVVGIIGQGFVGSAVKSYFDRKIKTVTYDKYKTDTGTTLEEVVKQADVIFVCVPTPMRSSTGECYTGIPEGVLDDINRVADEIARPKNSFVVCLKSTVPPGFTDSQRQKHKDLRIVFSPEFLTEKNSAQDMIQANRVIVGGEYDDCRVVLQYFLAVDQRRVDEGKCVLIATSTTSAEMAKLFGNGLLFAKVLFSNEVYALCKAMGINYDEVRILAALDPRVGASHTAVPGHDGHLGAGGHCLPKDLNNLRFMANKFGVNEKIFSAILERNDEVRDVHDWKDMEARAVIDR